MSEYSDEEIATAYQQAGGNKAEAARTLNLPVSTFKDRLGKILNLDGASTLYDGSGNPKLVWVKEKDDQKKRHLKEYAEELGASLPRVKVLTPPKDTVSSLTNLYTLTDAHIGALAWKPEAGADWDIKIAEHTLTQCYMAMVRECPKAGTAVISLMGDWLHYDGMLPITTQSGHVLDSDSRNPKMTKAGIRIARRIVDNALKRHEIVILLIAEGNHDIHTFNWLRELFINTYEAEPRLRIIDNPRPYYAVTVGSVFLGFHHGHLRYKPRNPEAMVALFADEYPMEWGRTTKRYIHTGHFHHKREEEPRGAQVIQHPTIAGRDAYAARYGFGALRNAIGVTYHQEFGEKCRNLISPEMLK